jgi:phosphoribosyl 1,2-cyclic phosphodiesterase
MRVTFHGVRGSTPCQSDDILRYGGNTSCVSIGAPGQEPLVLDMGTGLRYFGKLMADDEPFRGHCLLSHLHWDHVQGLPFFTPLLREGSSLDVYGPAQADGRTLNDVVSFTIRPPLFPVSVDELPGDVRFHDTADAEFTVGDFEVMSRLIPHLGPTLGFRVTFGGRSVAYLSDHQQPFDGSMTAAPGPLELIDGVDLLIHDSQYTPHEFEAKSTWGHCTTEYAVWLAGQGGVKNLALFHHDPSRRDDDLDGILACAKELGGRVGVNVIAASEGLVVDLD